MALALTRREGEEIVIVLPDGREMIICVRSVDRMSRKALLLFDAPQDVKIHRREVHDAMKRDEAKKEPPYIPLTPDAPKSNVG